jgi:hypothetical protein
MVRLSCINNSSASVSTHSCTMLNCQSIVRFRFAVVVDGSNRMSLDGCIVVVVAFVGDLGRLLSSNCCALSILFFLVCVCVCVCG